MTKNKSKRKQVLVQLIVDVDASVPVAEVRAHAAKELQASKGQFTGTEWYDWRSDIKVRVARNEYPKSSKVITAPKDRDIF